MLPFIGGLGDAASNYRISRSLRFRSNNLAYLTRTNTNAPTDGKKGSFSAWVKRTATGVEQAIVVGWDNVAAWRSGVFLMIPDAIDFQLGGAAQNAVNPATPVVRDVSGWFHILCTWDTTIPVQNIYYNGILVGTAAPPLNLVSQFTSNAASNEQRIGMFSGGGGVDYFEGMMTEINLVDGQMLTPAAFGYNDAYGIWQPRKYAGTYGTNGYYLDFSDNSNNTSSTLGKDRSGNNNDLTPTNIATTDSSVDVPTRGGASSNLAGGLVRGNYPIWQSTNHLTTAAISNGGLTASGAGNAVASMGIDVSLLGTTEKVYWEIVFGGANGAGGVLSDVGVASTAAFTTGQNVGFRINVNGDVDYTTTGTVWTNIVTGTGKGIFYPYTTTANAGAAYVLNGGNRTFIFPMIDTTYHELVTTLMPDYKLLDVRDGRALFDVALWTGTGVAQNITGKKFQPGIVWGKNRTGTVDHYLVDGVRGSSIYSIPNKTDPQVLDPGTISSLNADGFSLGVSGNLNTNTNVYVGWMFKQVARFSDIQVFAKAGGTNETFNHNLGQKPGMMFIKPASGINSWMIWHKDLAVPTTDYVGFDGNAASSSATAWNSTAPTATQFTLGTLLGGFAQVDAYLFGEIPGFCKIGVYTGTGVSGLFIPCGFKPAFVVMKRIDVGTDWIVLDTARGPVNPSSNLLFPDTNQGEAPTGDMDMLSNGWRNLNAGGGRNQAGGKYVYMAIAEHPFKYARAR